MGAKLNVCLILNKRLIKNLFGIGQQVEAGFSKY